MSAQSIPAVVMAGISFYVGLYHLLIYVRRKQRRHDLTFALLCLATGLYDVFCAGLYNANSVVEGAQWQRMQFIALALLTTAFLWFVSDYNQQKPGATTYIFSAYYLLAILVQIFDRSTLTWLIDRPAIKELVLPLGLKTTYYEATLGPFSTFQGVVGIMASTYILWISIRFFRRGRQRKARPLLLALGLMYAAAVNDTLVSQNAYQFVYAIEYAYLAMIILMAYSLSSTIVEAATTQEVLRASEERFRALVETTSDWVWETDVNGVYTYASPRVRDLLGYEPEEIIGKTPFDLMPPDEIARINALFWDIWNSHQPFERLENTVRHKKGHLVVLETNGMPFLDANGKPGGYRGIDRDITERKEAQEDLLREKAFSDHVLDSLPTTFFMFNDRGELVRWNARFLEQTGFSAEEIKGRQATDLIAEQDRAKILDAVRHVFAEGRYAVEAQGISRDGTTTLYHFTASRMVMDGQAYLLGAGIDITERRRAEKALQESEERFRSIVENALTGIFTVDDAYRFVYVNDELCRILQYPREELVRIDFRNVLSDESRAFVADYYIRRQRGEQLPSRYELSVLRQDGQVRHAEMSVTVVKDTAGIIRTMGQLVDITERKQAEESLARRAVELRKLYEASLDINAQPDMTMLLNRIVEHGAALIGALQGTLFLLQSDQTLELVVLHNLPVDFLGARLNLGEGLAGRAAQEGKPIMVEDYQTWEGLSPAFVKLGARRALSVPLKARNRVIGALSITDTQQRGGFSEDEMRLLSLFADQAAVTIENTRLYEEAQHRAEYLATTNEISRAISTLQDPDSVLEVIYRQVQRTVPADTFYIGLYDAERNQISFPIMYDLGVRYYEPDLFLGSNTWLADVLHTGQPFMLHRSAEELHSPIPAALGDKSRKSASVLIVPLWQKERVAGVLSVQSYTMNAYNNHHAEILTGVGVQAMIAIENARLFTAAQQELEERKRIQVELETKNAELERFAYTVSHDLKSPLITIGGFVGFLEKDALTGNVEQVKTDAAHINDALTRMQLLLDELLELSRIGRLINPPEEISFATIAREAVEAVRGRIEAHSVEVEITPGLPTVYVDRARLVEVMQNLVDNACKFMGGQPQPRIEIGMRQDGGKTIFYVRDNGTGIDSQYQNKVFELFEKLDPQSEGTGVGLAIVRRIIETHSGKIWVESDGVGRGTTFYFTLPAQKPDAQGVTA